MDLYKYESDLLLFRFWWRLKLSGAQEGQNGIFGPSLTFWTLDFHQKVYPNCWKAPVTWPHDFNTKFADDPTDPAQLIAHRVWESMDLWEFLGKYFFCDIIKWRHIIFHFSRTEIFPPVARDNCAKFGLVPNMVPDFQKNFHWKVSKNVLLAIPFSLSETRTLLSECPRVPRWQYYLISVI